MDFYAFSFYIFAVYEGICMQDFLEELS